MAEARRRRKKKQQSEYFFDYSLLFIVLFLLGFGLIMIYSASSYEAYDTYGDAAFYMKKQLVANIIGLVGMIIIANIPYHFWERFAMLGYVVSMILIFLVKTPLGISSHGATRWIGIPHTGFNLQPAEVAKLCMILFLASLVCKMGKSVRTMKGFFIMMGAPLPIAACEFRHYYYGYCGADGIRGKSRLQKIRHHGIKRGGSSGIAGICGSTDGR